MHPVFHVSFLKPWCEGTWSRAVEAPVPKVEQTVRKGYLVDRILKYRTVKRRRRQHWEYLVIWSGYPLEEAEWIPEENFHPPAQLAK